jgi:hypothetical protein
MAHRARPVSAAVPAGESFPMAQDPTFNADSLPVSDLREIDRVCRQFEAACKAGRNPKIECQSMKQAKWARRTTSPPAMSQG